jgi:drug/metabolite transporter (DMT)-like permease
MDHQELPLLREQTKGNEFEQLEDRPNLSAGSQIEEYLWTSSLSIEMKNMESLEHHKNPFLGYTFICISVLGMTVVHIASKIAFTRKETLTNIDCISFYGIWLTLVFFIWSKFARTSLSLRNLPNRPLTGLLGSWISTICCNVFMLKGVKMISVGKSTLIFSTNPMFSMILASILLSEKISKHVIWSTIGAFFGIYFLTINKENVTEESHLYLGIFFVILAALFQAFIFVFVRMVSVYNLHFTVRPTYAGISFAIFSILVTIFYRDGITFESYDLIDFAILSLIGVGWCTWVGALSLAMQYEEASKLTPCFYLENVMTLLADAFLFDYHFRMSDFIGIFIVAVCLWVPAIVNYSKAKALPK